MREFIPEIIVRNIDKEYGVIEGYCFQIDISGFTSFVDRYSNFGKSGLESISEKLSYYSGKFYNIIYKYGGYISNISGDAFTSIFEGKDPENILSVINEIIRLVKITNFKEVTFKMTVSYGKIEWGIIKNSRNVFYFRGNPVDDVFEMQKICKPGQIKLSQYCIDYMYKYISTEKEGNVYNLVSLNIESNEKISEQFIYNDISAKFYPELETKQNIMNEFREVVSIFIGLKRELKYEKLKETIIYILEKMEKYGGYFNSLDFSDKGGYALINFGAPVCWENNIERSCDFVLELIFDKNHEFRIGMNYGISYCGIIGNEKRSYYSCIGTVTNIAAKTMINADENNILITEKMNEIIKFTYKTEFYNMISFKGIYGDKKIFRLIKKHLNPVFKYEGIFMGRNKEIEDGRSFIKNAYESQKQGILYIFGEKGIGKSRYTNELIKKQDFFSVTKIYLKGEFIPDILLSPIKKYFASVFNRKMYNFDEMVKRYIDYYNAFNIPEEIMDNFNLYRGVYKYLAGVESKDNYNKNKKVIFDGVAAYLKTLSYINNIMIIIDDLHLFDNLSVSCINYVLGKLKDSRITCIINSRYYTNQRVTTPIKSHKTKIKIIELDPLKKEETESYLGKVFTLPVSHELSETIYNKTKGNPYYLEEYTKYLKENNYLDYNEKIEIKSGTAKEIPLSIGSLIISKYDSLCEECKKLVRYAAALGEMFDRQILYECVGTKDFFRFLESGESYGFWYKVNNRTYKFRHSIICEIIYSMQFKSTNDEIHRNIALKLLNMNSTRNPNYYYIASHFEIAGEKEKAIKYYEKAYEFYYKNYMNDEAVEMLKKIKKITKNHEIKRDCDFREIIILKRNGDFVRLIKVIESYLGNYYEKLSEFDKATILHIYGVNFYNARKYEKAEEILYKSLEIAEKLENKKLTGMIKGSIGVLKLNQYKYDEGEKLIKQELYTGLEVMDKSIISSALRRLALLCIFTGKTGETERYLKILYSISKEIDHKDYMQQALSNLGYVYTVQGLFEKAKDCYKKNLAISMESGNKRAIYVSYGNLGYMNMKLGNFEEFEMYNKKKKEILEKILSEYDLMMISLDYGEMHLLKDEYQKAIDSMLEAYNSFMRMKRGLEMGYCTFQLARAYYKNKEYEKALEFVKIASEKYSNTKYNNYKYLCEILESEIKYSINHDFDIVKTLKDKIEFIEEENIKAEVLYDIWTFEKTRENADKALYLLNKTYEERKEYYLFKIKEEIEKYYM